MQSGNIRNPSARPSEWILDETVWTIHEVATGLVRNDPRYAAYRPLLDDEARMRAYLGYRDRVFLPVRPLETLGAKLRPGTRSLAIAQDRAVEKQFIEDCGGRVAPWRTVDRLEDVRYCTRCLQSCHGRMDRMTCVYNPVTSREGTWAVLQPAVRRRRGSRPPRRRPASGRCRRPRSPGHRCPE